MSPRTRWYLRGMPTLLYLLLVPLLVYLGNWVAIIVIVSVVAGAYLQRSSARWLYQAGWYGGRVSAHLDVHDIEPEPWKEPWTYNAASITCPRCGRTSYHPEDIREGYCGACEDWTTPR